MGSRERSSLIYLKQLPLPDLDEVYVSKDKRVKEENSGGAAAASISLGVLGE